MKPRYISRHIEPNDNWPSSTFARATYAPKRIEWSITHPGTGRRFGMVLEDDCGKVAFYGPPFMFSIIKRALNNTLPRIPTCVDLFVVNELLHEQHAIKHHYA